MTIKKKIEATGPVSELTADEAFEDLTGEQVVKIQLYFGQTLTDLAANNTIMLLMGLIWGVRNRVDSRLSLQKVLSETSVKTATSYFTENEEAGEVVPGETVGESPAVA